MIGSTNTNSSTVLPQEGKKMLILTAVASDQQVKPGKTVGVTATAHMQNGSAIKGANIKVIYADYFNSTNMKTFNGTTDKTGDFSTKSIVPKDTKTSQWVILVGANKPGFRHSEVSTGFAVTTFSGKDSGGSSSSGSSSSSSSHHTATHHHATHHHSNSSGNKSNNNKDKKKNG